MVPSAVKWNGLSCTVSKMGNLRDDNKATTLEIPVSSRECSDAVIGCCRVPSRL